AIAFIVASIFFSNYLSKKIAADEKSKVEQFVEAVNDLNNISNTDTRLAAKIISENGKNIPLMQTNEKDSIIFFNFDSSKYKISDDFLKKKLEELKAINPPLVWKNPINNLEKNITYYGESDLLIQIKYFPIVQLLVALLFVIVISIAMNTKSKSTQNQVWAGLAKEAAHQLGTPLSSLQGWMEILKDNPKTENIAFEMSKDVDRLKLVSDRFGKIGSTPKLEETNLNMQIESMVAYIKKRSPERVNFSINTNSDDEIIALINPPLFDWVIENLLKNALDAMDGKGKIEIDIKNEIAQINIDVKDTGKGIAKNNLINVFKPGFSTKQRGWGLGLSLSKRIINIYHKGDLFVKQSEIGKGTTFRIVLKK
ncbi:MAG: HAMP domain-containing sensor histidine kinase, partial [Ferruginibacter sp.]